MDARNGALVLSKHGWLSRMPADFRHAILKSCVWQRYEPGSRPEIVAVSKRKPTAVVRRLGKRRRFADVIQNIAVGLTSQNRLATLILSAVALASVVYSIC